MGKALNEPLIEPKEEPVLQEIPLEEQLMSKWKKKNKQAKPKKTNLQIEKEQENSSGTDTLESGSWESIVLETLDGVRREFIVKPSTKTKPSQGDIRPKPKHKEVEDTSILVVTRAQAQQDPKKKVDSSNPKSSNSQKI